MRVTFRVTPLWRLNCTYRSHTARAHHCHRIVHLYNADHFFADRRNIKASVDCGRWWRMFLRAYQHHLASSNRTEHTAVRRAYQRLDFLALSLSGGGILKPSLTWRRHRAPSCVLPARTTRNHPLLNIFLATAWTGWNSARTYGSRRFVASPRDLRIIYISTPLRFTDAATLFERSAV